MGKISRALRVGALTASLVMAPVVALSDTLADALVGAYTHSGLIDQNRALLRAADEDVAQAVSALLPIISWSGRVQREFGDNRTSGFTRQLEASTAQISLTAELLLYDFGRSKYQIASAKEAVLATRQSLVGLEQRILQRTVAAYMGVVASSEQVALRENNQRLLIQELRAAKNRFEVGEVTRTDVALAEAQLAQARSGLASAQGEFVIAVEEYRSVVGRKPGRLAPPPALPKIGSDMEGAKALAVRNHPSMKSAQHQVAAADWLVKAAKAAMQPTVRLRGQLSVSGEFGNSDRTESGSVGIQAGGPIYQGGRLSSLARQAQARRDAQRGNLHAVRHQVQQDVGTAYARLAVARAQIEASKRRIRAAQIAFDGVREEAKLGARTTLDVLNAEQSLLDAKAALISAQSQLYTTAYGVLAATGRLTARDLRLPVKQYDPEAYYNLVKDSPAKMSKQGRQLDKVLKKLGKK